MKAAGQQFNATALNQSINDTVKTAGQIKIGGKIPAFSQVNPNDWSHAVQEGDTAGLLAMANQLGLKSAAQTQLMFEEGEAGPLWAEVKEAKECRWSHLRPDWYGLFVTAITVNANRFHYATH